MLDQVRINSEPMIYDSSPTENKRVINYWLPLICSFLFLCPNLAAIVFVGPRQALRQAESFKKFASPCLTANVRLGLACRTSPEWGEQPEKFVVWTFCELPVAAERVSSLQRVGEAHLTQGRQEVATRSLRDDELDARDALRRLERDATIQQRLSVAVRVFSTRAKLLLSSYGAASAHSAAETRW
jgi:hypothetical protein